MALGVCTTGLACSQSCHPKHSANRMGYLVHFPPLDQEKEAVARSGADSLQDGGSHEVTHVDQAAVIRAEHTLVHEQHQGPVIQERKRAQCQDTESIA